ncbi:MAG TPA: T9SS type A sorting domain-containing protein [Chitinophagales bacterium]|nr:T9SS type A sorting domain-containing protein [Chitinophagales bacterium]
MKKNLLISLSLLLLYSGSSAQTAIPCSINYATTNRKALSGDLAGFNNNADSWRRPINFNSNGNDPSTSTANNAIDIRLANIIKDELGEIVYRNSGGNAEFFNLYYKGWGNSNPAMPVNSFCIGNDFPLYGANKAPYVLNNAILSDNNWRANPGLRDAIYNGYQMYLSTGLTYPESKDNIIYPIINIINSTTNNKTATYVINIDAHYKKQKSYFDCNNITVDKSIRAELFNKTSQLWTINTFADLSLPANNFSQVFKDQVRQNVDAILTMMLNGVDIKYIELGNEHGLDMEWFDAASHDLVMGTGNNRYNDFVNLPIPPAPWSGVSDQVWRTSNIPKFFRNSNDPNNSATFAKLTDPFLGTETQKSFDAYGALLHMYINVIRNEIAQKPAIASKSSIIKFGVSIANDNYNEATDSYSAAYLKYLFTHQDATNGPFKIGFTGYVIHPYFDISATAMTITTPTSTDLTNLDAYFNDMKKKATAFINAKYRLKSGTINSPTITTPYYPANNTFYSKLPTSAELWLTEWDAVQDPPEQTKKTRSISNTILDAMYYMDAHIAMQDINTGVNMVEPFTGKNNLCQLANYHLLFGSPTATGNSISGNAGPGESILGINYGVGGTGTVNDGISRQAVFYAHKILKPLFTVKPDYIANVNGGFTFPSGITKDSVSFRTYIKENVATGDSLVLRYCNKLGCFSNWHSCFTDKEIYIYFNNKSNRDYKIDLSTALTGQTGRVYSIEQNRMYATKLSASRGITTFRTDTTLYETVGNINTDKTIQIQNGAKFSYYNTDGTTVSTAVKNFIISKYSLGYIKITLRVYSTPQPNLCALPQRIATSEIKDIDDSKKITDKQIIYPNPTTGLVNLNVQLSEPVDKYTIEVFSVDGRVVLSEIHNEKLDGNTYVNNTINISNQPNGVYFIRIISDKNVLLNNKVLLNK